MLRSWTLAFASWSRRRMQVIGNRHQDGGSRRLKIKLLEREHEETCLRPRHSWERGGADSIRSASNNGDVFPDVASTFSQSFPPPDCRATT